MLGAIGDHVLEIVGQDRHVKIEVGDHGLALEDRITGEIVRPEFAFLFPGQRDEQDRAARRAAAVDEGARNLEDRRHSGGIVEHPVHDPVALGVGRDEPEVVEVRAEDDHFLGQPGVAPGEQCDDILAVRGGDFAAAIDANSAGKGKAAWALAAVGDGARDPAIGERGRGEQQVGRDRVEVGVED